MADEEPHGLYQRLVCRIAERVGDVLYTFFAASAHHHRLTAHPATIRCRRAGILSPKMFPRIEGESVFVGCRDVEIGLPSSLLESKQSAWESVRDEIAAWKSNQPNRRGVFCGWPSDRGTET